MSLLFEVSSRLGSSWFPTPGSESVSHLDGCVRPLSQFLPEAHIPLVNGQEDSNMSVAAIYRFGSNSIRPLRMARMAACVRS